MHDELPETDRTRLRRKPERGRFDRATINSILDEAIFCTVAFADGGRPWAVPMVGGRIDDTLYLHGNLANHVLTTMAEGIQICVAVTLVDASCSRGRSFGNRWTTDRCCCSESHRRSPTTPSASVRSRPLWST